MTQRLLPQLGLTVAAAIVVAGCASQSPPSSPPPAPPPPPTVERTDKAKDLLAEAAQVATASFEGEGWQTLFDGGSLAGWQIINFAGGGEVRVDLGLVELGMGSPFTGIRYTNNFPKTNYEIAFDAMRTTGSDFFCGLTVPVGESHCSLIVGGWGGGLLGISCLDGYDASENETTKFMGFDQRRWYRIRLRVTTDRIEGWIDAEKLVNVETTGRRISVRPGEIEECIPLGIASWQTGAAVREIKWRPVSGPAGPLK